MEYLRGTDLSHNSNPLSPSLLFDMIYGRLVSIFHLGYYIDDIHADNLFIATNPSRYRIILIRGIYYVFETDLRLLYIDTAVTKSSISPEQSLFSLFIFPRPEDSQQYGNVYSSLKQTKYKHIETFLTKELPRLFVDYVQTEDIATDIMNRYPDTVFLSF